MTTTWDNNGACVECGYVPFQITAFCSECIPSKLSINENININEKIKNIEERLSQYGVQYLFMNDFRGIPIIYQDDYEELDNYLRAYKHFEYVICRFSGEKVCDPEEQLIIRVRDFVKCRTLENSIEEFDGIDEVKEQEISYYPEGTSIEADIHNIWKPEWTINLKPKDTWEKVKEVYEDKSTYDEMFDALQGHNNNDCNESIHYLEDQIYRRFIKDIANKKLNINEIINLSDRIKKIIIDPNDGAWDSCRWYA